MARLRQFPENALVTVRDSDGFAKNVSKIEPIAETEAASGYRMQFVGGHRKNRTILVIE